MAADLWFRLYFVTFALMNALNNLLINSAPEQASTIIHPVHIPLPMYQWLFASLVSLEQVFDLRKDYNISPTPLSYTIVPLL